MQKHENKSSNGSLIKVKNSLFLLRQITSKLSTLVWRRLLYGYELSYPSDIELIQITGNGRSTKDRK